MRWSLASVALLLVACSGPAPRPVAPPAKRGEVVRAPAPTSAGEVEEAPTRPGVRRSTMTRINVDVEETDLREVMNEIGAQVGWNILVDSQVHETVTITLRDVPWRVAVDLIARRTRCEVEERRGRILLLTQPPRVTLQFADADVRTVIHLLAASSGKNIVISPRVRGNVTVELRDVHWLRALRAIARTAGDYEVVRETSPAY